MNRESFSTTFSVDRAPDAVFDAINDVRAWWSGEVDGVTDQLGSEFTYRYKDLHRSTQRITELVRGTRIVWHVLDSSLSFVKDTSEWTGTDIVFEIREAGGKTEVCFTHRGLLPRNECYRSCANGWSMLIHGNLHKLITTGGHQPDVFTAAQDEEQPRA